MSTANGTDPSGDRPILTEDVSVIELFTRPGCPYCSRAQAFLAQLLDDRPEIILISHDISRDAAAVTHLEELAVAGKFARVGVPAIFVRGRLFIGFDRPETTGRAILFHLDPAAVDPASLAAQLQKRPTQQLDIPGIGEVDIGDMGLPAFTVLIGMLDGLNPCAMWMLILMLALILQLDSGRKVALVGTTFIVVGNLTFLAFLTTWMSFFVVLSVARAAQIAVGAAALLVAAVNVYDLALGKIRARAAKSAGQQAKGNPDGKPRPKPQASKGKSADAAADKSADAAAGIRGIIYAATTSSICAAAILAWLSAVVQLHCTAGLPAIYGDILASYDLPTWQSSLYAVLYHLAYALEQIFALLFVLVIMQFRRAHRRSSGMLRLVSVLLLLPLGVLLIVHPLWLSWT